MERRRFLAAVGSLGAAGLAGCASALISEEVSSDDGGDSDDGGSGDGGLGGGGLGGDGGAADVEIEDYDLVLDDEDTYRDPYVEPTVHNAGDGATGDVDVNVDWYDENGDYLGDSSEGVVTLAAGETWRPRIPAGSVDDELVADCDLSLEVDSDAPRDPADIEIVESDLVIADDGDLTVVGRAANETGDDVSYIEAYAKLYDAEGHVLASEWTNESDVPAGSTWRFDLEFYFFERGDAVEDYEVGVDPDLF